MTSWILYCARAGGACAPALPPSRRRRRPIRSLRRRRWCRAPLTSVMLAPSPCRRLRWRRRHRACVVRMRPLSPFAFHRGCSVARRHRLARSRRERHRPRCSICSWREIDRRFAGGRHRQRSLGCDFRAGLALLTALVGARAASPAVPSCSVPAAMRMRVLRHGASSLRRRRSASLVIALAPPRRRLRRARRGDARNCRPRHRPRAGRALPRRSAPAGRRPGSGNSPDGFR